MDIVEGQLDNADIIALLREHLQSMAKHSPPQSVHALDLHGLAAADVTFYSAWRDGSLLGCGALKQLHGTHGEIKSMRTSAKHLGEGVASALLRHIIAQARQRSYTRLSLETGSGSEFDPAHSLYEKFGFDYCGPFGQYQPDDFSRFMTLQLIATRSPAPQV